MATTRHPRLIVIGDVHGCREELLLLLDRVQPRVGDRFLFLGDLVDRGPDPPGTVATVRALIDAHPGSEVILGNHEAKLARRPASALACYSDDDLTWLGARPLWARDRSRDVVCIHGGFFPRYFEHYGPLPEHPSALAATSKKQRSRAHRFVMIRHVNPRGDMVGLGDETAETHHWAESYDGREGFACFGHEPYMDGPRWFPHAVGLDAGCVFGGELLAAVWDGPGPGRPTIIRQPALATYASLRPAP